MSIPSKPYFFIKLLAEVIKAERVPGKLTIEEKTSPPRSQPPTEMKVFNSDFFFFRAVNSGIYSSSLAYKVSISEVSLLIPAKA